MNQYQIIGLTLFIVGFFLLKNKLIKRLSSKEKQEITNTCELYRALIVKYVLFSLPFIFIGIYFLGLYFNYLETNGEAIFYTENKEITSNSSFPEFCQGIAYGVFVLFTIGLAQLVAVAIGYSIYFIFRKPFTKYCYPSLIKLGTVLSKFKNKICKDLNEDDWNKMSQ